MATVTLSAAQWQLVVENQKLINWKMKPYRSRLSGEVLSRLEILLQDKLEEVAASYTEAKSKFASFYSRCVGRMLQQFFAEEHRNIEGMRELQLRAADSYSESFGEQEPVTVSVYNQIARAARYLCYDENKLQLCVKVLQKEITHEFAGRELGITRQGMEAIVHKLIEQTRKYGNPLAA